MHPHEARTGDLVTTVSMNRGFVTHVKDGVLTIKRKDKGCYYASMHAVIALERDGVEYVVKRRINGHNTLLVMATTFGQSEFQKYKDNRS